MNKHEKFKQEIDEFTTKVGITKVMLENNYVGLTSRDRAWSENGKIKLMRLALDVVSKYEMSKTLNEMQKAFESFGKETDAPSIKWPEGSYRIDPDDPLNHTPKIPLELKKPWKCCGCPGAGMISQFLVIRDNMGAEIHKILLQDTHIQVEEYIECSMCDFKLTSNILMQRKGTG